MPCRLQGSSFATICEMTDIFEGSIVRFMRRLDELIGQLIKAASVRSPAVLSFVPKKRLCILCLPSDIASAENDTIIYPFPWAPLKLFEKCSLNASRLAFISTWTADVREYAFVDYLKTVVCSGSDNDFHALQVVGEVDLASKFEESVATIRRDIIFSASLYI